MRPSAIAALVVIAAGAAPVAATAQGGASPHHVVVPTLEPRPADVSTLDGIIAAFYDVITGPAGQPRQWGRDRTLYWPGIRFFAAGVKSDGSPGVRVYTHQEYVDDADASMMKNGFAEREIHRVTQRIGNVVHVMSTYETRRVADGPITGRGVNSIDLFWDGKRWWITAASWDDERPNAPIPPELLN